MEVSTIEDVAKLSARKMKTTARVGAAEEDASMTKARPALAKINALGLVTVDSQMGKKSEYISVVDEGFVGVMWQRAYVYGFMSRERAADFAMRLDLVGGIAIQVCEHAKKEPSDKVFSSAYKIPVTRFSTRDGDFAAITRMPMLPGTLEYQWSNLLPETGLASDLRAMKLVAPNVVQISIVDMQWGRPMWLYDTIVAALSDRGSSTPLSRKSRKFGDK